MKKPSFSTLLFFVVFGILSATSAYAQPDTTNRARRADSVKTFFVGNWGPFDKWWQEDSSRQRFGRMGEPDTSFRYYNIEDSLGLNAEFRGFWDFPLSGYSKFPAPKDTVLGGKRGPSLPIIGIEPLQLFTAFDQAYYLRFEFERHVRSTDENEYLGFLTRSGLTGSNSMEAGASFPKFLGESTRHTDTNSNSVRLDNTHSAGVFADSMWHSALFAGPTDNDMHNPAPHFLGRKATGGSSKFSRKMLMRIKVKITESVADTVINPPTLCLVTRTEKDYSGSTLLVHTDTIKVTSIFKHINSDFDIVELRFLRDSTQNVERTTHMEFSFYWPKEVNAVFDYMELLTAHIDTNDTNDKDSIGNVGFIGYPAIDSGDAGAFSGEDFLDPNSVELGKLVSRIKRDYLGRVNYLRIGDEFPISQGLPFKRLVKLVRDSTEGKIEVTAFTVDSATGWFGKSLMNAHEYNFEGRRKGWVDTNYADPKMQFFDPYVLNWFTPLPKRTITPLSDTASLRVWQDKYVPTRIINTQRPEAPKYSPYDYLIRSQQYAFRNYLDANREGRRWVERQNNGSNFGIDWQAGAGMNAYRKDSVYWLSFAGLRPPTGPEMKVTGHLSTSCGSSGLLLYLLTNFKPGDGGENGGVMMSDGTHDSMYYSSTVKYTETGLPDTIISGRLWMGFKERYDTVRALIPSLITYGTKLLNTKRIGDWTASELLLASDSLQALMPFIDSSIRTYDDSFRQDAYLPTRLTTDTVQFPWPIFPLVADTANRTFVHISMWIDTVGGANDTLLYITNMRTDDSYDTTEVPTTIDRRLITMKMKRAHIIEDVAFPQGAQLDNEKIWTPYVGTQTGDSLKLFLKAGDGILIRLADTTQGTMRQTRIAMNYPKNGEDFNDHGRIVFNRPVPGVLDKTNSAKWSIPSSSRPYIVGIPDTTTAKMWQDSLLYRTVHSSRTGRWRHQNWTERALGGDIKEFSFQKQLAPLLTGISQRQPHFSTDSLAHNIRIKTEFETGDSGGMIKFYDPFFVDSTTLFNTYGDISKHSPFLPQTDEPVGTLQGGHHEKYGGIFIKQNPLRDTLLPIYGIGAYKTIISSSLSSNDYPPSYTDWSFLHWWSNDSVHATDPSPWWNPTFRRDSMAVIFMKDGAKHVARYKAHLAAYAPGNLVDTGFSWNNQRKLYFDGTDTSGKQWYRMVYQSLGRIYTTRGYRTGVTNAAIIWEPEELISDDWEDPNDDYPALSRHFYGVYDTSYRYVYQHHFNNGTSEIRLAHLTAWGTPEHIVVNDPYGANPKPTATPVIASLYMPDGPVDVVAWAAEDGIHMKGYANLWNVTQQETAERIVGQAGTSLFPTIYADSCYLCTGNSKKANYWVAWQQPYTTPGFFRKPAPPGQQSPTTSDIFQVQYRVGFNKFGVMTLDKLPGTGSDSINVSIKVDSFSYENFHPCIAGARLGNDSTLLRIAYENRYSQTIQRVAVTHQRTDQANSLKATKFFTSMDTNNQYWKPSIEITRYHDVDTALQWKKWWYSLAHEKDNGGAIQHWAMDSATQRTTSHIYLATRNPQIAYTYTKVDSDVYRMCLSTGGQPLWLIPGYVGLYKYGGNDTLWEYRTITDRDTASELSVDYSIGEITSDDGLTRTELEFIERDENEERDSLHSSGYFTTSERFTLPDTGTVSYYSWIRNTSDSLLQANLDEVVFALDFYDTTGAFVTRLDSIVIDDSTTHLEGTFRTVNVERVNPQTGYVAFHRVSEPSYLNNIYGRWSNTITNKRFSTPNANKRAGRNYIQYNDEDVVLNAVPNPFRGSTQIQFGIPDNGPVIIEVVNSLGQTMAVLKDGREYRAGVHSFDWKSESIPAGVYVIRLRFGNIVKSLKIVSVK